MIRHNLAMMIFGLCFPFALGAAVLLFVPKWKRVHVDYPARSGTWGVMLNSGRIFVAKWSGQRVGANAPRSGPPNGLQVLGGRRSTDDRWDRVFDYLGAKKRELWGSHEVIDLHITSAFGIHVWRDEQIEVDAWSDHEHRPITSWVLKRRLVFFPSWLPALIVSLPFGIWASRLVTNSVRQMKRRRRSQCVGCGYQLLDENLYCPECGLYRRRRMSGSPDQNRERK